MSVPKAIKVRLERIFAHEQADKIYAWTDNRQRIASALVLSGIVDVNDIPGLYVVFPLAAIFYGMFLICRMMQWEVAQFDTEERKQHALAARHSHFQSAESLHGHEHHEPMRA